jgi:hypothetical protein
VKKQSKTKQRGYEYFKSRASRPRRGKESEVLEAARRSFLFQSQEDQEKDLKNKGKNSTFQ